jgi:hypothetical protein
MQSAKSSLYFVLSAAIAVAAGAVPCLLVQCTPEAHTAALDSSTVPIDAQLALAR